MSMVRQSSGSCPRPLVSVITATIPERKGMLNECVRSVRSQTVAEWEHLILEDEEREGCSVIVNRMVARAKGEWLLPLADDDLILPACLSVLLSASEQADVVYSPPLVWGLPDPWWFFQVPPAIPSTALVRKTVWVEHGGYDETAGREEDRKLWTRMLEAGVRFVRADTEPTWVYRVHVGSKSMAGRPELAAA